MIGGLTETEIIAKIKEKSGLSNEDLQSKIKQKMDQLSGLISKEGAAYIVANELGIQLLKMGGPTSIADVKAGMRNLEVTGKVQQIFEVRDFNTAKGAGKVGSFLMADKTGSVRVVLWHDATHYLEKIKEGDVTRLKNAYAKENNGKKELHLTDKSSFLINPPGITVELAAKPKRQRKHISELTETDTDVELFGTIVQTFDPFFFEICPTCGKRAKMREGIFYCDTHKEVTPAYSYVMNLVLDDSTQTIRTVFFRNQLECLLNKTHEELIALRDKRETIDALKNDLLGNMVKLVGKVTKNTMFDRLEFIAQMVFRDPNPDEELAILNEIEKEQQMTKSESQ